MTVTKEEFERLKKAMHELSDISRDRLRVLRKMRSLAYRYRNLLVKVRDGGFDWKQFRARNSW